MEQKPLHFSRWLYSAKRFFLTWWFAFFWNTFFSFGMFHYIQPHELTNWPTIRTNFNERTKRNELINIGLWSPTSSSSIHSHLRENVLGTFPPVPLLCHMHPLLPIFLHLQFYHIPKSTFLGTIHINYWTTTGHGWCTGQDTESLDIRLIFRSFGSVRVGINWYSLLEICEWCCECERGEAILSVVCVYE